MNLKSSLQIKDIEVLKWLNAEDGFKIAPGKVVAIHAFQMLCPGCVLHGVPQANKLSQIFDPNLVQVLGLHTVFEHHEAMQEPSLKAFLHEFRVLFPVGIDVPSTNGAIPKTMERFRLQGTPSWLIFDKSGALQILSFGKIEDLALGSEIARLVLDGLPLATKFYRQ